MIYQGYDMILESNVGPDLGKVQGSTPTTTIMGSRMTHELSGLCNEVHGNSIGVFCGCTWHGIGTTRGIAKTWDCFSYDYLSGACTD